MTVIENMKQALSAVGTYRPDAPHLGWELAVYAEELERLHASMDAIIRERFLQTAGDRGLRAYEELFGPPRSAEALEDRRRRLRLRLSLGGGDFTPAGIRRALDSFGLDYIIDEFPRWNRLNILARTEYTKAQQRFIERETAKIIPAHIEFQMVFNTLAWSALDARNKTFAQLDTEALTWAQIDALEQEG